MSARTFNPVVTRRPTPAAARPAARPATPARAGGARAGLPRFVGAPAAAAPAMSQRSDRWEIEARRVSETAARAPVTTSPTPAPAPTTTRITPKSKPDVRPASLPAPRHSPPPARPLSVSITPAIDRVGATGATGAPLAPDVRRAVEAVTGVNLAAVRVHTGPEAAHAAASVHARAFTVGSHIYLDDTASPHDRALIAHEVAHAIQQSATLHAAHPRGPPQSALALTSTHDLIAADPRTISPLTPAPAGMIQREEAAPAPAEEEGFFEMGFWTVLEMFVPQQIIDVLREIQRVGFWEFLKRKISGALDAIFAGLRSQGGFTAQLADIFQGLLNRGRTILAALISGDCEPLFAAVREFRDTLSEIAGDAWDSITEFLAPVGEYLSGVWEKFGAPVVDFLGEFASDVWNDITTLGNDLWELTAPARDYASSIWTEIKNLLGFGEGGDDDGSGGLVGWITDQAGQVWDEIKIELDPVIAPIREVVDQVQAILPLDAILNLRETVTTWMDQAMSMADTMEADVDVAQEQDLIRDIVLPGVRRAITSVNDQLTAASSWVTGLIGDLVSRVTGFFSALSQNTLLSPLAGAIQWLSDEATALGEWAHDKVVGVFDLAHQALDALNTWIEPVLNAFQRLIASVSDLMSNLGDFVLGPFMLIPQCIRDPIQEFLVTQILSRIPIFAQLLEVPNLWARAQTVFRRIVVQIFRDGNLPGAAWTFFREVIQLFGLPPELITNLIRNAARAIGDILRDPVGFLLNLFRAIGTGFTQFLGNFASHLLNGVANWLFGALGEAGIRVPTEFSLRAVVDVVMQVLDITQERIFRGIERRVGPERTAQIRRGLGIATEVFGLVRILITEGPAGLWREILSRLSNLWSSIVSGVMDFLITRVVAFATRWLLSLLDVTGIMPVINSIIAIYNAIQSFVQYLRQLIEIVNSVFEGLGEIARGVITRGANLVEANLGRLMPIAIGFLANQIGLGDLPNQIRRVVGGIRARVDTAIDWVVDRIVRGVQAVASAARSGAAAVRRGVEAALDWLGLRRPFRNASGETHQLYFQGQAENAELIVESTPRPLVAFLQHYEDTMTPTAPEQTTIAQIRARVTEIENIKSANRTRGRGSFTQADGEQIREKYEAILLLLQRLRGDSTTPPPTVIARELLTGSGDGKKMVAAPLSINPGGYSGGQPFGNSPLWRAVSRRKRRPGGNTFYVRGHLLNHHLHGAGSIENMIPITSIANGQMERLAETHVKRAVLDENKVVKFEVEALFAGGHGPRTRIPEEAQLPSKIRMRAMPLRNEAGGWVEDTAAPAVMVPTDVDNILPGENEGHIEPIAA